VTLTMDSNWELQANHPLFDPDPEPEIVSVTPWFPAGLSISQ
jgi:hypothetical protein